MPDESRTLELTGAAMEGDTLRLSYAGAAVGADAGAAVGASVGAAVGWAAGAAQPERSRRQAKKPAKAYIVFFMAQPQV